MLLNPSSNASRFKTTGLHIAPPISPSSSSFITSISSCSSSPSTASSLSTTCSFRRLHIGQETHAKKAIKLQVKCSSNNEPLKVMISGAPASGKGTQCELIVQKFGLVHISTGDLLRAEVAAGTDIGNKAKEYMNSGRLVPDDIVTAMVRARLSLEDAVEKGWLLDGYPRTSPQAQSLEELGIRPDVFIVLEVPDEILINRCVGRRLDPMTGKIYHIESFPPETEEIKARLVTRPDDTEEKVKSRLLIYKRNAETVSTAYADIMKKVDGNRPKEVIFEEIKSLLSQVQDEKVKAVRSGGKEVDEQDDMFILVAPQNAVGNCIIDDLSAMTDAAGPRPVILINPRLKDLPGSSGIMQTMGRDKRLEYAASFESCYLFRLLFYAGTQYPIMGALRMSYPFPYEVYKRVDEAPGKEKYVMLSTFKERPTPDDINNAFLGKPRDQQKNTSGIWGFLSGILALD